jgi:very-short-patch-repair endonuclease
MTYSRQDSLLNQPIKKPHRRALRADMPEPEKKLWYALRDKQIGARFRRQYGIGPYIADFCCPSEKLVVEVDGDSHFLDEETRRADATRESFLYGAGFKVLRFTNRDVMENLKGVLAVIEGHL